MASREIQTIGSDHSPSPPDMKTGDDFFKIWGGISGVQHTLPLLITETALHQVDLPKNSPTYRVKCCKTVRCRQ